MPQSLSKVYLHIIFSTKNREVFIKPELDSELYRYLGSICAAMKCPPIQIGGASDHVHIACCLGRSVTISELIGELKSGSSKWVKTKGQQYGDFYWKNGYGAFSIGESQIENLKAYIKKQREHHKAVSFKDEFRKFLKKYSIEYDERYVWD